MDNAVENYTRVINKEVLAPACGEGEADPNEGEANQHVPSPDVGDWVEGLGDIEGDDPEKTKKE